MHLHGFLRHSFSGQSGSGLFLKSRARLDRQSQGWGVGSSGGCQGVMRWHYYRLVHASFVVICCLCWYVQSIITVIFSPHVMSLLGPSVLQVFTACCLLIYPSIHPSKGISIGRQFRQFSSMLVLVGRVTSATSFDPTYAAIIQNKDKPCLFRHLHFCKQMQETLDTIFQCISPKHLKGKFEYDIIPLSTFSWFFFTLDGCAAWHTQVTVPPTRMSWPSLWRCQWFPPRRCRRWRFMVVSDDLSD